MKDLIVYVTKNLATLAVIIYVALYATQHFTGVPAT